MIIYNEDQSPAQRAQIAPGAKYSQDVIHQIDKPLANNMEGEVGYSEKVAKEIDG